MLLSLLSLPVRLERHLEHQRRQGEQWTSSVLLAMSSYAPSPHSVASSLPSSSRRPSKFNSSIPLPPRPDFSRRSSTFSSASVTPSGRKSSTVSALNGKLSKRRESQPKDDGPGGQRDWASMEPDEVFRRLPVGEVKKVESFLRTEALNKQSELRSMVGTRYRDLLLSTSQITALHSSSLRLSSSLKSIARACANPEESQLPQPSAVSSEEGDAGEAVADAVTQLPLAAHMKLLLDAPETLYSQLAHHSYLHAAFLWLLSRVVKEGIASLAPQEPSQNTPAVPYLPLLQKQWETLLPFRSQIVQRATASLRERGPNAITTANTLAHTLLAIILLDSISISEALALFLTQRMRTMRDILQSTRPTALSAISQDRRANQDETKRLLSPAGSRRNSLVGNTRSGSRSGSRSVSRVGSRRGSFSDQRVHGRPLRAPRPPISARPSVNARDAQAERDKTAAVLVEAVNCLVNTTVLVREVFEKRQGTKGESLLEELMRRIQEGEDPVQPSNQPAMVDPDVPLSNSAKVHQRRASRLASMSMPMPKMPIVHSGGYLSSKPTIVTTGTLLQTLPSSPILLRYLPPSILAFTPFISSSITSGGLATPFLAEKLAAWHESALSQITSAAPSWLHAIGKVRDVWHIRNVVTTALRSHARGEQEEEDVENAQSALEIEWARRVKAVWAEKLEEIVKLVGYQVEDGVDAIRRGDAGVAQDLDPSAFLFSPEITFPSAPSSTFASTPAASTAFPAFVSTLARRTTYRTPQLDAVLLALEALAADLKTDMAGIHDAREDLFTDYEFKMRHACERIVGALQKELEAIAKDRSGAERAVESELFVGRVALHLARNSTFVDMLRGGRDDLDLDGFEKGLLGTHEASLRRWTAKSVSQACAALDSLFSPSRSSEEVQALWQGASKPTSPSSQISVALHALTASARSLGLPPAVDSVAVVQLVQAFVDQAVSRDDWKRLEAAATAQAAVDLGLLSRLRGEGGPLDVVAAVEEKAPCDMRLTPVELDACLLQYMQRTQVLFAPLYAHLPTPTLSAAPSDSDGRRASALSHSRAASLLRFGAVGGDASAEFHSPMALARPAKRFGLLSIVA